MSAPRRVSGQAPGGAPGRATRQEVGLLSGRPVVVGAGLAGLLAALCLSPEPVVLLSAGPLGEGTSSGWAQGGVAASLGPDDDAAQHLADTLRVGDGLCEPAAAASIVGAAAEAIERLVGLGVRFDRDAQGRFRMGLEAGHSRRRIVHADGDGTGREIVRALVRAVRAAPSIAVLEGVSARRILLADGAVAGLLVAHDGSGGTELLRTGRVVLASGGIGGLFEASTNPPGSLGLGLALAARAGAVLADLEFVQFHPTALDAGTRPLPLVSEALRGEGAILVDETGRRFLEDVPGAELAPRDVVARAVAAHRAAGHGTFLDARPVLPGGLAERFPAIDGFCRAAGLDPARQPIPVRPAAHYHMGGVLVDAAGATSVPGLWACGEVASTGLHGANRLASNSLLEAAVSAEAVARSLAAAPMPDAGRALLAVEPVPGPDAGPVRPVAERALGVLRTEADLATAVRELRPLAAGTSPAADPALVALMIAVAARRRRESRGAHSRLDHPRTHAQGARSFLTLEDALGEDASAGPSRLSRSR